MSVLTSREYAHSIGQSSSNVDNEKFNDAPPVAVVPGGLVARNLFCRTTNAGATVSGTAYFVYLGTLQRKITAQFLKLALTVSAAGAQTAEIGLFSSPSAPSLGPASVVLTPLIATGTLTDLTAAAPSFHGNVSAFNLDIASGTHLYAGVRFAMATTQPNTTGLTIPFGTTHLATLAGSAALTAPGAITAVPSASAALGLVCPDLILFYT